MKILPWIIATTLFATPAVAKDITVTLNDKEQKLLAQLLDLAVKAGGLKVATPAAIMLQKFQPQPDAPNPQPSSQPEPIYPEGNPPLPTKK